MAKKIMLAVLVFLSFTLLTGAALAADGNMVFNLKDGGEVGTGDEFDFTDEAIHIEVDSQVNNTENMNKYVNISQNSNFLKSKPLVYENNIYSTGSGSPFDLSKYVLKENDTLTFTAVINNTVVAQKNITLNPQAPTVKVKNPAYDKVIEGDKVDLNASVTDPSGVSNVYVKVSVDNSCGASLDKARRNLTEQGGEYVLSNYELAYPCEYMIKFYAEDKYGNAITDDSDTPTPPKQTITVHADLGGFDDASKFFTLTGINKSEVGFLGEGKLGAGLTYDFEISIGGHKATFSTSFSNSSDKKDIESKDFSTDDVDSGELNYTSSVDDGFSLSAEGASNSEVCFEDISEKQFVLYCSEDEADNCDPEEWSIKNIDSDGCTDTALGSQFVLATCAGDYWYNGECHDEVEPEEDTEDSGGDESGGTPGDDTATTKTTDKSEDANLTGENATGGDGTDTETRGGMLAGMGTFVTENKSLVVPIGIAAVVLIGLLVFVIHRKRAAGKEDKPSIHELAKQHEVNKPKGKADAKKLKHFAEVAVMMGHSPVYLRDALKYRGWDPDTVNKVFKETNFKEAKKAAKKGKKRKKSKKGKKKTGKKKSKKKRK